MSDCHKAVLLSYCYILNITGNWFHSDVNTCVLLKYLMERLACIQTSTYDSDVYSILSISYECNFSKTNA